MSPAADIGGPDRPAQSPGADKRKNWYQRAAYGSAMAAGALTAILAGRPYIEIVVVLAAVLGLREWRRLVKGRTVSLVLSAVTTAAALTLFAATQQADLSIVMIWTGAFAVFMLEVALGGAALWSAVGVLYLGLPGLAIVVLRDVDHNGAWLTASLFLAVWATDTGAFIAGKLIGGPKLVPCLSPNKTWAGFIGGTAAAAGVEAALALFVGSAVGVGALYGVYLGLAAHAGDLFESAIKRHFHVKDSGGLIPGHGGVLDRIDSTLVATLALAVLVFHFHFDPLFGANL